MTTIDLDDEFEKFMHKVNPCVDKTSTQYRESRRVFFAGCTTLYVHMIISVTTLSDDDAMKELDNIGAQLKTFTKLVKERKD